MPRLTGALALRQASPHGEMFTLSRLIIGTCSSDPRMQYSAGLDPYYPGIDIWFYNTAAETAWNDQEVLVLDTFRIRWGLSRYQSVMLAACTTHIGSAVYGNRPGNCDNIVLLGSILERDPLTNNVLMCREGPFIHTVRVLATLKSSMAAYFHHGDIVLPQPCAGRGFPSRMSEIGDDWCFPPMSYWVGFNQSYAQVRQSYRDQERHLIDGAFTAWTQSSPQFPETPMPFDVLAAMYSTPQCNCAVGSEWYLENPTVYNCTIISPIRSWWQGNYTAVMHAQPWTTPTTQTTTTTRYCDGLWCGNYTAIFRRWAQYSHGIQSQEWYNPDYHSWMLPYIPPLNQSAPMVPFHPTLVHPYPLMDPHPYAPRIWQPGQPADGS